MHNNSKTKKIIYISSVDIGDKSGISKKILNQVKCFTLSKLETELVTVSENSKIVKILPFSSNHAWKNLHLPKADFLYIRYVFSSFPFINLLKEFKNNNPNSKIVVEIPCYPYEDELKHYSNFLVTYRDKFYRRFLKKYVDALSICVGFKEIFGIPAIEMVNCVSVDDITPPKTTNYRNDKNINVTAVAAVAYYHGYDRFIKGLYEYYQKQQEYKVIFHFVGDGPALCDLKKLTKELKLENYVKFYGFMTGNELDQIYDLTDIGLDALGGHRKGDIWFGTLKSREYICKGIPFVTEYPIPENLDPIKQYILKVPSDESAVDVEKVVELYTSVKREKKLDVLKKMRDFAYTYCDVSVAMNPIIDFLEGK